MSFDQTSNLELDPQPVKKVLFNWSSERKDVNYTIMKRLGQGSYSSVFEVRCQGVSLAEKHFIIRRKSIRESYETEVENLKKLNHKHIIRFIGTYTEGLTAGILLWPLAICDLAVFLAETDQYTSGQSPLTENWVKLKLVGIGHQIHGRRPVTVSSFLLRMFGCLANAI